jgi:hypothetical protein
LMATENLQRKITLEEFYDQTRVKWIFSSCYQYVYVVPSSAILLTHGICLSSETNNTVSYFDWYSECDVSTQGLAFQVSTALYTFPIPIFALLVGQTLAYLIQKWAFGGFIYQWAIASVHLLCSLQLGRSIMIWVRGQSSKEFGLTRRYDSDIYSNAEDCNDIMTCLLTDGNDIVRLLGFAPISNTNRALVILTCALIGLFLLEFALLSHQCAARKRKTNDRKTCLQRLAICLARRN